MNKSVNLSYFFYRINSMKKLKSIIYGLVITLLIAISIQANAQNIYQLNVQKSDLVVKGTSTLHDWSMDSKNFNCKMNSTSSEKSLIIQKIDFSCNSNSLKSENSLMDKKAWSALEAYKFHKIQFESTNQEEFTWDNKNIEGEINGTLLLTGKKKDITIPFKGVIDNDGNLKVTGEVSIKMSEFGIDPPTALLGSLKTGDEVTIEYNLLFNKAGLVTEN